MFYANVNASALVFTTPRQNAYSAKNPDLSRFLVNNLPLASTPLRQAQDNALSQLETRDCALSGVEGYNLGRCNLFWKSHKFRNRLLRARLEFAKRLKSLIG
jgi:hypothetical protein